MLQLKKVFSIFAVLTRFFMMNYSLRHIILPQDIGQRMGESPYSFQYIVLNVLAATAFFLFLNFLMF